MEYDLREVIKEYIKQKKNKTRILKSLHLNGRRQMSSSSKNNKPQLLPKDWKPEHFAEFQIPNPKFCEDRQLYSAHNYFIHPWWYDYCMRINEKQEKKLGLDYTLLPMYRGVLDKVQKYKKMKQQQLLAQKLFNQARDNLKSRNILKNILNNLKNKSVKIGINALITIK